MSNAEMLDMCVRFLIENHALVTDEHLEMLDSLWHYKYETGAAFVEMTRQLAAEQPLPPSPPPEPELWACDWCGREWAQVSVCHWCSRDAMGEKALIGEGKQEGCDCPMCSPETEEDYSCPNDDFCYASSIASDDFQEIVPEAHAQPELEYEHEDTEKEKIKKNMRLICNTSRIPKVVNSLIWDKDKWSETVAFWQGALDEVTEDVEAKGKSKYFGEFYTPEILRESAQNQLVEPVAAPLPKKPHNPIYTNYRWPSPIAKVFVQQIRGNNPWQYRYKGSETWPFEFKRSWIAAGNTELKLTHDNCMRYLAYKMGKLTPEQLMEKTPREVHAKLIGEYTGVPGYYTPRRWY